MDSIKITDGLEHCKSSFDTTSLLQQECSETYAIKGTNLSKFIKHGYKVKNKILNKIDINIGKGKM